MIRWLADAPALAGFYTGAADFPHRVRSILEDETQRVGVLATTVMQLARLVAEGRLPALTGPEDASLTAMLKAQGFALVPLDADVAEQAANLPPLHGDLFDRALVASAQRTGAIVLTNKAAIAAYAVPCLWTDG